MMPNELMSELKQQIKETQKDAESDCDGLVADLCNIFLRIIHNAEHMGQKYIVDRYWKGKVLK